MLGGGLLKGRCRLESYWTRTRKFRGEKRMKKLCEKNFMRNDIKISSFSFEKYFIFMRFKIWYILIQFRGLNWKWAH